MVFKTDGVRAGDSGHDCIRQADQCFRTEIVSRKVQFPDLDAPTHARRPQRGTRRVIIVTVHILFVYGRLLFYGLGYGGSINTVGIKKLLTPTGLSLVTLLGIGNTYYNKTR